jgi:P-type Cu+ transporter
MTQTRVFAIEGMTCHNCVRHVQRALSSVPGVTVADVNIGFATVSYDPEQVPDDAVVDAVREAGYQARPAAA